MKNEKNRLKWQQDLACYRNLRLKREHCRWDWLRGQKFRGKTDQKNKKDNYFTSHPLSQSSDKQAASFHETGSNASSLEKMTMCVQIPKEHYSPWQCWNDYSNVTRRQIAWVIFSLPYQWDITWRASSL